MSKYTMDRAWEPIEDRARDILRHDTWGHLFPENMEGMKVGLIRIALGVYGDLIILDEGIGIAGSPWWHASLMEFLESYELAAGDVWELNIGVVVETFIKTIPDVSDYSVDGVLEDELDPVEYLQRFKIIERGSRFLVRALG